MEKYVIVKLEENEYANTYDDIKPDKYLRLFKLQGSQYSYKEWTCNIECAIWFSKEEDAQSICHLLGVNTPWPLKVELIND